MEVIILAGGYGTRLYPVTHNVSKALLPIGDKTLIDFLIEKIRNIPVKNINVVTNNKFYKDFISWKQNYSLPIKVYNDGTETPEDRLGAIGDIEFVINKANIEDDILVLGGDNLFDWDLEEFCNFAGKTKNPVVGLFDIKDLDKAKRFGITEIDGNNRIKDFQEKPENPKSTLAGTCVYSFNKDSIRFLHEYSKKSKNRDTTGKYIDWLLERTDVYGYVFRGMWLDVGHKDTLASAKKLFGL